MPIARIERLRKAFLEHASAPEFTNCQFLSQEMRYLTAKRWRETRYEAQLTRRLTEARAAMYEGYTPVIDPDELIVAKPSFRVPVTEQQRHFADEVYADMPQKAGQDAHMALDYPKLLRLGTEGVRREITAYKNALDVTKNPKDVEKEVFYENCERMLLAIEKSAENYAAEAQRLAAAEANPGRQTELNQIAENLRIVPRHPARTLWQALQSVHFLTMGLDALYQMGRPDQYLFPFYEADLQSGAITKDFAQELIDCFCLLYNEYTPKSLAVGLMVGGRDPQGVPVVNELTYLFIQSIQDVRLSYPGVGLCVTPETPDDLLTLACQCLAQGLSHPALFNDEVIVKGLQSYGVPFSEATQYTHSTCVEITPCSSSGVWVASPYYNLLEPLLSILGATGGEPENVTTREELLAAYKARLLRKMEQEVHTQNRWLLSRAKTYTNPLVSCFVNDCLARGRDLDDGGARYAFVESSFVGLANLADAILAVDTLVFLQKRYSLEELAKILRDDFAGHEDLRQEILSRIPKYGNDEPEADKLVGDIARFITDTYTKFRTYQGFPFIPSLFCWIMHERLGSETGASPDGRRAGFPLGDGSGPAQGRERKGPTASILSSTSWEHYKFIGGIAVNMKFSKKLLSGESLEKMKELIRVYMKRGGFEFQINVVDREKLLQAQKHPEDYADLVVRIGGYSDYFTNLSFAMQNEVLLRTEHEI